MYKIGCGIAVFMLLLSSCTGLNDSYKDYTIAHTKYKTEDTIRITNQSKSIQEAAQGIGTTDTEKTLIGIISMMSIADLKPEQLQIEAPTTAYDVASDVVGILPGAITTLGVVRAIDKLAEGMGDEDYNIEQGDIIIDKSEVHSKAIGDSANVYSELMEVTEDVLYRKSLRGT